MPVLTLQITPVGPVVPLAVHVSQPRVIALKAANLPVPAPQIVRALIDTGASGTVIDSAVIRALGIAPTGQALIHTPSTGGTPHPCAQYDVALVMLMGRSQMHVISPAIPVIESNLARQGIEALLGRDVLAGGALWYNGHGGTLSLAF